MLCHRKRNTGALVAEALSGAWRHQPPAFTLPRAVLPQIVSLFEYSGEGGMVWRRLYHSGLGQWREARSFHHEYRGAVLGAAHREQLIQETVGCLAAAGIEPILIKGWATVRTYGEAGLRPMGDIDLCVRPDQLEAA